MPIEAISAILSTLSMVCFSAIDSTATFDYVFSPGVHNRCV